MFNMVIPNIVILSSYSAIIYVLVKRKRDRLATFGNSKFSGQSNKVSRPTIMYSKLFL